jgi:hypothetical protein
VPVRNGSASEDAPDSQRNDGALWPALAAAVALLVPPPEVPRELVFPVLPLLPAASLVLVVVAVVLPPLVPERDPLDPLASDEVPLLLDTEAVPLLTTEPIPWVEPLWACGTLATAVVPVVIAPGPLTVPPLAAPPADPPEAADAPVGFVLLSVALPGGVLGFASGAGVSLSFGRFTAPLPTWPAPPLPGVGPPTVGFAEGAGACCAATGSAVSESNVRARSSFILRQRVRGAAVPGRWPEGEASATVAVVRKDCKWPRMVARRPRRW